MAAGKWCVERLQSCGQSVSVEKAFGFNSWGIWDKREALANAEVENYFCGERIVENKVEWGIWTIRDRISTTEMKS
jgi:hypothetical protein